MQGLFGRVHGGEGLAIFPGQWFHGQAMDAGMVNNSTYAVNFWATEIMQGCMKGARGYNYKHSDIRKRTDLPERQINDRLLGKHYSLLSLPATTSPQGFDP